MLIWAVKARATEMGRVSTLFDTSLETRLQLSFPPIFTPIHTTRCPSAIAPEETTSSVSQVVRIAAGEEDHAHAECGARKIGLEDLLGEHNLALASTQNPSVQNVSSINTTLSPAPSSPRSFPDTLSTHSYSPLSLSSYYPPRIRVHVADLQRHDGVPDVSGRSRVQDPR